MQKLDLRVGQKSGAQTRTFVKKKRPKRREEPGQCGHCPGGEDRIDELFFFLSTKESLVLIAPPLAVCKGDVTFPTGPDLKLARVLNMVKIVAKIVLYDHLTPNESVHQLQHHLTDLIPTLKLLAVIF